MTQVPTFHLLVILPDLDMMRETYDYWNQVQCDTVLYRNTAFCRPAISYMKGRLLVQLDGFDMLGKLSNVRRYISAQGKTETFYNVIPSYCLLHAIWRLNKQPKKKS